MKPWGHGLKTLFNSYSEVIFLQNSGVGVVLLVITLSNVNLGIAGLISVLAAYLFARLIGMSHVFLDSGFYTYNALLVGLSIGYLFTLTPLSIFFVVSAGVLTFVISMMSHSILSYYLWLPALSLPFVMVSSIAYLASYRYSNLYVTALYSHDNTVLHALPYWIEGFFVSLGAIFFSPTVLTGTVLSIVILYCSRILFLLALYGYFLGATLSGLLGGAMSPAFLNPNNFNFILIAMAVGGVYLIPSPKSYLIAGIGVAMAILLLDAVELFWATYGIPAFTLPFNLVTLSLLYVLGVIGFPLVAHSIRRSPEETLDEYLSHLNRFKGCFRRIILPFTGSWTVWQGFNGQWTHQGSWQHAYDFVIEKAGKTHQGLGTLLEDYYAYRKPVMSPCQGHVAQVINHLPDNLPGETDTTNNWGNLVIITTDAGWSVELSHFSQNSIRVKEGDWIETGAQLGLCGNSGYSPQPHIHIQVQGSAQIGSPTLPFSFQGFIQEGQFFSNDLPKEKHTVQPLYLDRDLDFQMTFLLDSCYTFKAIQEGKADQWLNLTVAMMPGGETYFDSGHGKLFFNKDSHSFYFYRIEGDDPWLAMLFTALPRLPLVYHQSMHWKDSPPAAAISNGWHKQLINLLRAFYHNIGLATYTAQWTSKNIISGQIEGRLLNQSLSTEVTLHPNSGFKRIVLGQRCLEYQEETNEN
jgi:urea transporter